MASVRVCPAPPVLVRDCAARVLSPPSTRELLPTPWRTAHSARARRPRAVSFLFGSRETPADRVKKYSRQIKRSVRELDRERTALERQEKKLMNDIKKAARDGQMDSAKIMAKDLVRTRCASTRPMRARRGREAAARAPSEPRARLVAAGTSGRCTR